MSAPVSIGSVNLSSESWVPCTGYMLTSFASVKFWAGYMRKALIATRASPKPPFQMSVSPPDATAMFPRLSSPPERTDEAGSRTAALHRLPRAVIYLAFCESMVGYAFEK